MSRRLTPEAGVALLAAIAPMAAAQSIAALVVGSAATAIWHHTIWHHNGHVHHTMSIASAEYHIQYELCHGIKPLVGAFASSDGSYYLRGGAYRDFDIGPQWILTLHLSAGCI